MFVTTGPSAEAMPEEHMFCETNGRCGYGPSPWPSARLAELSREVLRRSVGLTSNGDSALSTAAAVVSETLAHKVSTTSPLSSSGDGNSTRPIQQLLIEMVCSLSSLCDGKATLSDMSHVSAHKVPGDGSLDLALATIKRLYLHLAAHHEHTGEAATTATSSVLRAAERIAKHTSVAGTECSLAVLEALALWQALAISAAMLWDALRIARCVTRDCCFMENEMGFAFALDQYVQL